MQEIDLKPESSEEATHRWTVTLGILGIAATMVSGELLKRRGIFRIPEAVIGLLVGVAAGGLSEMFESQTMAEDESFDDEFFMVWLLPPIIFAAGYNMNVPAFFDNLGPTMLLAFGGTVLSAAVVGACVYLAGQLGLAYRLSLLASFFFGSLISATDPVTVLAIFKAARHFLAPSNHTPCGLAPSARQRAGSGEPEGAGECRRGPGRGRRRALDSTSRVISGHLGHSFEHSLEPSPARRVGPPGAPS